MGTVHDIFSGDVMTPDDIAADREWRANYHGQTSPFSDWDPYGIVPGTEGPSNVRYLDDARTARKLEELAAARVLGDSGIDQWTDEDTIDARIMQKEFDKMTPEQIWGELDDAPAATVGSTAHIDAHVASPKFSLMGELKKERSLANAPGISRALEVGGRLGRRATQIPGAEAALTIGKAAWRPVGAVLGAAGPLFDVQAIAELSNQYEEAKDAVRHMRDTEMGATNYSTLLAAKQQRKKHEARQLVAQHEGDMLDQIPNAGVYADPVSGEQGYTLPDGTMLSGRNAQEMIARQRARQERGY